MRYALVILCSLSISCAAKPVQVHTEILPDIYPLFGPIGQETSGYFLPWLAWAKAPLLVINTPGGELEPSLLIALAVKTHGKVRCLVRGQAASGAFGILQQCQVRQMTSTSTLMTHEPSWHLEDAYDRTEMRKLLDDLDKSAWSWNGVCSSRLKMTRKDYDAKVLGKSWTMGAVEALAVGAVDSVIQ